MRSTTCSKRTGPIPPPRAAPRIECSRSARSARCMSTRPPLRGSTGTRGLRCSSHEVAHAAQYEWAGGHRGTSDQWLREGYADWVQAHVLDSMGVLSLDGILTRNSRFISRPDRRKQLAVALRAGGFSGVGGRVEQHGDRRAVSRTRTWRPIFSFGGTAATPSSSTSVSSQTPTTVLRTSGAPSARSGARSTPRSANHVAQLPPYESGVSRAIPDPPSGFTTPESHSELKTQNSHRPTRSSPCAETASCPRGTSSCSPAPPRSAGPGPSTSVTRETSVCSPGVAPFQV